jgi:hypothetical protein
LPNNCAANRYFFINPVKGDLRASGADYKTKAAVAISSASLSPRSRAHQSKGDSGLADLLVVRSAQQARFSDFGVHRTSGEHYGPVVYYRAAGLVRQRPKK